MSRIEGTNWWVEKNRLWYFRHWMAEVQKAHGGNLLPLQWVPDYVGVSRAAVYQRAKSGGLTVFSFIVVANSRTILGGVRERETRKRYDYAILSECDAWREKLEEAFEDAITNWEDEEERRAKEGR
ncbi:MAG: hypothetical protein LLG01_12660 [Planctomycetaceae bacterium]|nr:hypothetical protein [Planctomycetaceae bacterium]